MEVGEIKAHLGRNIEQVEGLEEPRGLPGRGLGGGGARDGVAAVAVEEEDEDGELPVAAEVAVEQDVTAGLFGEEHQVNEDDDGLVLDVLVGHVPTFLALDQLQHSLAVTAEQLGRLSAAVHTPRSLTHFYLQHKTKADFINHSHKNYT